MKFAPAVALIAGLIVTAVLIGQTGFQETGAALAHSSWGTPLTILVRVGVVVLAGIAWSLVLPGPPTVPLHICVKLRLIREAVNTLLPVLQVGGDILAVRLLTFSGTPTALATASVITDVLVQALTQFVFTIIGLGLLVHAGGSGPIVEAVTWGLITAVPLLAAFFIVQLGGAHGLVSKALARFAAGRQWQAVGATEGVYRQLAAIQARTGPFAASAAIHLFVWVFASLEVYFVLHFMGYPVGLAEAVAIESLAQAIRGAAFAVPGAIGVQEGGLIILCGLFGVSPQAALALSLIKRVGDLAVGIPGLLAWHALENRHANVKNT